MDGSFLVPFTGGPRSDGAPVPVSMPSAPNLHPTLIPAPGQGKYQRKLGQCEVPEVRKFSKNSGDVMGVPTPNPKALPMDKRIRDDLSEVNNDNGS